MKKFLFKKFAYPIIHLYWKIFQPITVGARGIIINNEHALLVKNSGKNYWSLPGGQINRNEDPLDGLMRELWEELRIPKASVMSYYRLGVYTSDGEGKHDTITIFVLQVRSSDFTARYELDDAKWFAINSLPSDISPATSRRVHEYLSGEMNIERGW